MGFQQIALKIDVRKLKTAQIVKDLEQATATVTRNTDELRVPLRGEDYKNLPYVDDNVRASFTKTKTGGKQPHLEFCPESSALYGGAKDKTLLKPKTLRRRSSRRSRTSSLKAAAALSDVSWFGENVKAEANPVIN